jgi:hypothetical protein
MQSEFKKRMLLPTPTPTYVYGITNGPKFHSSNKILNDLEKQGVDPVRERLEESRKLARSEVEDY